MAQQARPPSAGPSNFAWEGDSTLHSYCYDYMRKRGWNDSASRFAKDAGIDEATWTGPPIEAPQGLLYEWWSVFWDVFIARSQKAGQRNPNADLYVEAMRAKRDPLVVQFAGQNPPPPMNLPRSLAHPPRAPPSQAGGPPRAQYSQMHVLEQQELQNQMQRGRVQQVQVQRAGPGGGQPPPPGAYGPPGSQQPPHMHAGPSQGPLPPQHGGANVPQPLMPPYPPQNPHQPPSVHSSPHLVNASPYTNGRIPPQQGQQMGMGPPPPQQQQQQQQQGPMSAAMASAMNAVGLGGRDPDSLTQEEHAAVAAQMRRVGALPPTPQQGQMRNQPMRVVQQRMPPDQQMRQQGPYAQGMPPQGQQMMQDPNRPGMQQLPPQQRMVQAQYGPPPGQAGSPASPAYSAASPYTTPHVAHMQIPPPGSQSSPQQFIAPLPPPSRGAGNGKNRLPSAGGLPPQGSPAQMGGMQNQNAATKRLGGPGGGGMEDPSPRGRKRVRGGTRDEEMFGPGGMPETPNFDPGGPGSPGGMMGMVPGGQGFGPDGIPYRPSPSPQLMQPPDGKRPLPPGMGPPPQQQMYVTGPSPGPQQQQYMGGPGDMGMNGGGGGGHPGMNGTLSRPTSAASNHHFLGAPPEPDQRLSPGPHPQQGGVGGNGMPPPPPHQHPSPGQLGGPPDPNSLGVGGSRPFAGAPNPPSASTTPLPPPPQNLAPPPPDQQQANGIPVGDSAGGGGGGGGGGGDDVFAGIDNIDFDSFLNGDMFAEDGTS